MLKFFLNGTLVTMGYYPKLVDLVFLDVICSSFKFIVSATNEESMI